MIWRRATFFAAGDERHDVPAAEKDWPTIAPTEIDNNLLAPAGAGEVHDENAFAIGAFPACGVFSTAPDLAAFCQMLLNGGVYAHERILRPATSRNLRRRSNFPAERGRWAGRCRPRAGRAGIIFRRNTFWPHRIYRNFDLDRSGPAAFVVLANKPRCIRRGRTPRFRSARGVARCCDASAGVCYGCRSAK